MKNNIIIKNNKTNTNNEVAHAASSQNGKQVQPAINKRKLMMETFFPYHSARWYETKMKWQELDNETRSRLLSDCRKLYVTVFQDSTVEDIIRRYGSAWDRQITSGRDIAYELQVIMDEDFCELFREATDSNCNAGKNDKPHTLKSSIGSGSIGADSCGNFDPMPISTGIPIYPICRKLRKAN